MSALALFFSLTGASFAAQHYLITSPRQLAPSVRHALRGARGPRGFTGPQGPAGPTGPVGPAGQATDAANQPRLSTFTSCAVANVDYAGFGTSPQPITLIWTDNGTPIKTQTVQTAIPEASNNDVNVISVTPPHVPASDVLGLSASWTYSGGGQVGAQPVVSYC
jgi:hypothetical protein